MQTSDCLGYLKFLVQEKSYIERMCRHKFVLFVRINASLAYPSIFFVTIKSAHCDKFSVLMNADETGRWLIAEVLIDEVVRSCTREERAVERIYKHGVSAYF